MTERIIETRPDYYRACVYCQYADKATEKARQIILEHKNAGQLENATITVKCEGGNYSQGILGVSTDIRGKIINGSRFIATSGIGNVECPGIREERSSLSSS